MRRSLIGALLALALGIGAASMATTSVATTIQTTPSSTTTSRHHRQHHPDDDDPDDDDARLPAVLGRARLSSDASDEGGARQ